MRPIAARKPRWAGRCSVAGPIDEVLAFFREWATVEEMAASFRARFTPQTVWENIGAATTTGPEEAVALLDGLNAKAGITRGEVIVHHVAAAGDVVLTERTDIFYRADGGLAASIRVMGAFEMDGPRILGWRDYFDPRGLMD
jgi:limonene-1,2-epoxide hydrolase